MPFLTVTVPPVTEMVALPALVFVSVLLPRSRVMFLLIVTSSVVSARRVTVSLSLAAAMAAWRESYFLPLTSAT